MPGTKEALREAIELLSEEEALEVLEFVRVLGRQSHGSLTLRRLLSDPAFTIRPSLAQFDRVTPAVRGEVGEGGE